MENLIEKVEMALSYFTKKEKQLLRELKKTREIIQLYAEAEQELKDKNDGL